MRSFIQAATFLPIAALALAIPPYYSPDSDAVAGSIASDKVSAFFSIPCRGCFADADEELDFELTLEPSALACQPSAFVLNGARFASKGSTSRANTLFVKANTTNRPSTQDLAATWEISCLNKQVTLLSFTINEVLGQPRPLDTSGFSASFRQSSPARLLRLENTPVADIGNLDDMRLWTEAQDEPDFVTMVAPTIVSEEISDELQQELRRLHEIKAHIGRLHHKYMRQERRIFDIIKQDFNACEGATCIFQTAIRKAPDFFELVKAHFKHRPDWKRIHGDHFDDFHQVSGIRKQGDSAIVYPDELEDGPSPISDFIPDHTAFPVPFDEPHRDETHFPPHPPPPPPKTLPEDEDFPPPPPPPNAWAHHPPPPPFRHGRRPPWADRHGHSHQRPHFFHRHGPHKHPLFFSAGTIFFFVIVASLLFKCVRAKTNLINSNRRRRDCAARREECRNRAAYRRAAIRHRWQRWWSQFRQPASTADYEEKRARILNQEGALEDVMQSEIQELRRAHEIVGDMMRAEESRQRLHHEANFGSSSTQTTFPHAFERTMIQGSEPPNATPPVYFPPPPSYDQELEGDLTVVDGFRYTPSATDSTPDDNTPESSVVDCNSRMSFETDTTITRG